MDKYKKSLSIIIPCYNEAKTLKELFYRLSQANFGEWEVQVIVVDDGSTDNSVNLVPKNIGNYQIELIRHIKNQGKGSAVRSGLAITKGDYTIIQDADLEYNPKEIINLLNEAEKGDLVAVYGSRNLQKNRSASSVYYLGGWFMTIAGNVIYKTNLTDQCTCYKLVKTDILKDLELYSKGFQLDTEITIKLARLNYPIKEVSISYNPRSKNEGKKIGLLDAIMIFLTILKNSIWLPTDRHFNKLDRIIRYYRVRQAAKFIKNNSMVLDIGSGSMCYLYSYLAKHKSIKSYIGLDRRDPEVKTVNNLLKQWDVDNNTLPLPDKSQDCVTMLALVEHLKNPADLIKEANRVLIEGGILIITTPSPQSRFLLETMAKFDLINKEEIDEHEHYFTPKELETILIGANFKANDIKVRYFELGFNIIAIAIKT